jgi:hypothetical protein
MLPQAEINTAGVIIAVSTATAEDIGSIVQITRVAAAFVFAQAASPVFPELPAPPF